MGNAPCKSVVLVDDEKTYTNLLTQLLSDHFDCPIISFARPLEALAALPTLNPGVIVTDFRMPQLNGLEFITRAVPLVPGIPFVLITGHTTEMLDHDEIAKIPALKSVLWKPFGWHQLSNEIARLWPDPHVPLIRRELQPASN